jgi:hypothetical protein
MEIREYADALADIEDAVIQQGVTADTKYFLMNAYAAMELLREVANDLLLRVDDLDFTEHVIPYVIGSLPPPTKYNLLVWNEEFGRYQASYDGG